MVVLYHLHDHLTQRHPALIPWRSDQGVGYHSLQQGHLGVQLFFVISGFILAMPFAKWHLTDGRPVSLGAYYWRRLTRLEPPYIINLLLFFFLLVVFRGDSVRTLVGPLVASLTYTHNVVYGEMSRINFVAWSLELEAQFYLIAPMLAHLYRIRRPYFRRFAALLTGLCALAMEGGLRRVYGDAVPTTILGALVFFSVGWVLADMTVMRDAINHSAKAYRWDVMALIALFVLVLESTHLPKVYAACLLGILVMGTLRGCTLRKFFMLPWIVTIGGMCYTIYLYHFLLLTAAGRIFRSISLTNDYAINFIIQAACILPIVLIVCTALFLIAEKPFMVIQSRPVSAA